MSQVQHVESTEQNVVWKGALWSFLGVGLGVLANVFAVYTTGSISGSSVPNVIPRLSFFLGGLLLLGIVIVGIASFMQRKNREVILLKRSLSGIYLSALRKSALNPRLQSSTAHD